jgi:hypothetical protein
MYPRVTPEWYALRRDLFAFYPHGLPESVWKRLEQSDHPDAALLWENVKVGMTRDEIMRQFVESGEPILLLYEAYACARSHFGMTVTDLFPSENSLNGYHHPLFALLSAQTLEQRLNVYERYGEIEYQRHKQDSNDTALNIALILGDPTAIFDTCLSKKHGLLDETKMDACKFIITHDDTNKLGAILLEKLISRGTLTPRYKFAVGRMIHQIGEEYLVPWRTAYPSISVLELLKCYKQQYEERVKIVKAAIQAWTTCAIQMRFNKDVMRMISAMLWNDCGVWTKMEMGQEEERKRAKI